MLRPYVVDFSTANKGMTLEAALHILYDHASFKIELDGKLSIKQVQYTPSYRIGTNTMMSAYDMGFFYASVPASHLTSGNMTGRLKISNIPGGAEVDFVVDLAEFQGWKRWSIDDEQGRLDKAKLFIPRTDQTIKVVAHAKKIALHRSFYLENVHMSALIETTIGSISGSDMAMRYDVNVSGTA